MPGGMEEQTMAVTLSIPDMSCGHCRASIEAALKPLNGVTGLSFDAEARTATIEGDAPLTNDQIQHIALSM